MSKDQRGQALIISCPLNSESESIIEGYKKDMERMKSLFEEVLHFKVHENHGKFTANVSIFNILFLLMTSSFCCLRSTHAYQVVSNN